MLFSDIACICNTFNTDFQESPKEASVLLYKKIGYWESKFVHDK